MEEVDQAVFGYWCTKPSTCWLREQLNWDGIALRNSFRVALGLTNASMDYDRFLEWSKDFRPLFSNNARNIKGCKNPRQKLMANSVEEFCQSVTAPIRVSGGTVHSRFCVGSWTRCWGLHGWEGTPAIQVVQLTSCSEDWFAKSSC